VSCIPAVYAPSRFASPLPLLNNPARALDILAFAPRHARPYRCLERAPPTPELKRGETKLRQRFEFYLITLSAGLPTFTWFHQIFPTMTETSKSSHYRKASFSPYEDTKSKLAADLEKLAASSEQGDDLSPINKEKKRVSKPKNKVRRRKFDSWDYVFIVIIMFASCGIIYNLFRGPRIIFTTQKDLDTALSEIVKPVVTYTNDGVPTSTDTAGQSLTNKDEDQTRFDVAKEFRAIGEISPLIILTTNDNESEQLKKTISLYSITPQPALVAVNRHPHVEKLTSYINSLAAPQGSSSSTSNLPEEAVPGIVINGVPVASAKEIVLLHSAGKLNEFLSRKSQGRYRIEH